MTEEVAESEKVETTAQIPSTKLEIDGDWPKGTIININMVLRVRARTEGEDRKGTATLHHHLAVEEASISNVMTPVMRRAIFEAQEAALAAQQAQDDKVIAEEPGIEDQQVHPGFGQEMTGVEVPADGTSATVSNEDWSDVDEADAAKRAAQDQPDELHNELTVESVERVGYSDGQPIVVESDADQYEPAEF